MECAQQSIHNFLRVLTLSTDLVYWLLYLLVLVRGSMPFHAPIWASVWETRSLELRLDFGWAHLSFARIVVYVAQK